MDQESIHPNIIVIYGVDVVDGVLGDMFLGGFPYFRYWNNYQQGLMRASYLMGLIQSYALPNMGINRFPWLLLHVVADILQNGTIYAWVPILLAHIYKEFLFYSLGDRSSLSAMITLQAWAYEHIHMAHPHGLPIPRFETQFPYLVGIL